MKISFGWLKELVPFSLSAEELGEKLTRIGLETEAIEKFGGKCEKVVVGEILDIQKHPQADKLTVCQVDTGKERLQIVCGAKNMKVRDRVPVALVGALLPNGVAIEQAKLRGVDSFGMMCSPSELRLAEESNGLLILPAESKIGADIRKILPIEDAVLTLNVTPNRGDCLSHLGIAREVGALLQIPVHLPEIKLAEEKELVEKVVSVEIEAEACRRYTARIVREIAIGPSPLWLKLRLERCGVRPVSNIVDITNYVLLELGQPLHAFDFAKIGGGKIRVRWAKPGETLVSIDGKERRLTTEHLAIADQEKPVALAGVMGGKESEVSESTRDLLIESAAFAPETIRKMSKGLGLASESSYRFERGIDLEQVEFASRRAAQLIQQIAGGKILKGGVDKGKKSEKKKTVSLRLERINHLLGTEIAAKVVEPILKVLSIEIESKKEGKWQIAIPSYRHDLTREADLAEEIARFYGYDKIPATQPNTNVVSHEPTPLEALRRHIVDLLAGLGFHQVVNYSFIGEKELAPFYGIEPAWKGERLEILNPIREDQKILRPRLLPSLLKTAHFNLARDAKELRIFELGKVYHPSQNPKSLPQEKDSVTLLLAGNNLKVTWKENNVTYDFYDIKGITESIFKDLGFARQLELEPLQSEIYHPGQAAQWKMEGRPIAYLGQLHPQFLKKYDLEPPVYAAEIFLSKLEKVRPREKKYHPIPRFPKASRDIALVVDEGLPEERVREALEGAASPLLETVHLFDLYIGPQIPKGKKSLAYSLHYRSKDATLTDEEVNQEHGRICRSVQEKLHCEFRM